MQNEVEYNLDRKSTKTSALSTNNLDKYEYLTGEHLDLKPSINEQAKFEHSPLCKIFNRALDKNDQKEKLFKRVENTADKIKSKNKTETEPIENGEQSEVLKDESTMANKKPKKIVLLKDQLDFIFKNFGSSFNSTGKTFLAKFVKFEKRLITIICFLA